MQRPQTGYIRSLGKGGEGIIDAGTRTVFVPGGIPGETVEFKLDVEKKGIFRGHLTRVIKPSPHRIEPTCSHFGDCGGCNLQHIEYPFQVQLKKEILSANLRRIGRISEPFSCEIVQSPPLRYRTRAELQVKRGVIGYYARGTHRVIPFRECPVIPKTAEDFLLSLPSRHPSLPDGEIRILSDGDLCIAALATPDKEYSVSPGKELVFSLDSFTYRVQPCHFFQANRFLLPVMLRWLRQELEKNRYASAVDLFSGIGFFTVVLRRTIRRVFSVENHPANIEAMHRNLEENPGHPVQVLSEDAYRCAVPSAELLVADPPRSGLTSGLITRIFAASPRKIVYISCDSATFSRDCRLLLEHRYRLDTLKIIDHFPQTDHLEIFSTFSRE